MKKIRQCTLETLGLGTVLEIFREGRLPATADDLVSRVFGPAEDRGSLVISGANGIVGAGKCMQLGSRLLPYDVPLVALDLPGSPDGLGKQYQGLVRAFGRDKATKVMENIVQLTYDGKTLPDQLKSLKPKFLLEAIPEILELKKSHYEVFRSQFPDIEIKSVTSGFPSSQLGVGIAHPAFPHEINKVYEVVEEETRAVTKLLWALGLIPMPVSDHWSFVLDVLFCGITLTGLRYHRASNMPYWKIDKYIRKLVGPNPFRAHDAIGAKGANFLTWSCLHHLAEEYGDLFTPTPDLVERVETGQTWYPLNHFRPVVDWSLDDAQFEQFETWILGPLCQMVSLMVHEQRSHFAHLNAIGEHCAQFRQGVLAKVRSIGRDRAISLVEGYHKLHPEAGGGWHPKSFDKIESPDWQHLYVNGLHDGEVGVISISRESYNHDVDSELNRTIDWLKEEGVEKVIVTGDFHLSTQMVGADTTNFFPALKDETQGINLCKSWSSTARRLHTDFHTSVGFVAGKRCLGGMLELLLHCHYLVAHDGVSLGFPEVTIPVVPGMEGCHWSFRKAKPEDWPNLYRLLLEGLPVPAKKAQGWLVDFAGPMEEALKQAWNLVSSEPSLPKRDVATDSLEGISQGLTGLSEPADEAERRARDAIVKCIIEASSTDLANALEVQSRHSAGFMTSDLCRRGSLGAMLKKTMSV